MVSRVSCVASCVAQAPYLIRVLEWLQRVHCLEDVVVDVRVVLVCRNIVHRLIGPVVVKVVSHKLVVRRIINEDSWLQVRSGAWLALNWRDSSLKEGFKTALLHGSYRTQSSLWHQWRPIYMQGLRTVSKDCGGWYIPKIRLGGSVEKLLLH